MRTQQKEATALLDYSGRYLGCWWVTVDGLVRVVARATVPGLPQTTLVDSQAQATEWLQVMSRHIK